MCGILDDVADTGTTVANAAQGAAYGNIGDALDHATGGPASIANSLGHVGGDGALLLDEADALLGKRTQVQSSNDRSTNLEPNDLLQDHGHGQGQGRVDGIAAPDHAGVALLEQAIDFGNGHGHDGMNHGLGGLFDQLASGQNHALHSGEHHGLGDLLNQIAHMEQQMQTGRGGESAHGHDFGDSYHTAAHVESHHDFQDAHGDHSLAPVHTFDPWHHH